MFMSVAILNQLSSDTSFTTQGYFLTKKILQRPTSEFVWLFVMDGSKVWRNKGLKNVNKHLKIAEMVTKPI